MVSGTLQNLPGPPILATTTCRPPSRRSRLDGRCRAAPPTSSVGLIDPGTVYGDRLNQVDFRVSKMLRFDRTRTTVSLDFYNMMNVSTVLAQNNTFGSVVAAAELDLPGALRQGEPAVRLLVAR